MTAIGPSTWQDYVDPACPPFQAEQESATAAQVAAGSRVPRPGMLDPVRLRRARLWNADGSFRPAVSALARDDRIPTPVGDVAIRRFGEDAAKGLILHFHGGGWVLGSIHEQDLLLEDLALRTGALIVSISYPLAPEHQLPVILETARCAAAALIDAHPGVPVGVVGESAGAQVALQTMRALCPSQPTISAAALAYGIYDLAMTPSQRAWGSAFVGLSTDWLSWFYAQVLPGSTAAERRDPRWSPLHADMTGLPPVLLGVGSCDPLLDDSVLLAQRLVEADVDTTLRVYPAAAHGFNHLDTAMARYANATVAMFLRSRLRGHGRTDSGYS